MSKPITSNPESNMVLRAYDAFDPTAQKMEQTQQKVEAIIPRTPLNAYLGMAAEDFDFSEMNRKLEIETQSSESVDSDEPTTPKAKPLGYDYPPRMRSSYRYEEDRENGLSSLGWKKMWTEGDVVTYVRKKPNGEREKLHLLQNSRMNINLHPQYGAFICSPSGVSLGIDRMGKK